jgi:hypothetical protein
MPLQTFILDNQYVVKVQAPTSIYPITKIKIGGHSRQCVAIDVYDQINAAYMAGFSYHKKCNLTEDLVRSEGTRNMMMASLAYVLQVYPKLIGVTLRDNSKILCNNGIKIPLYYLSLILHGSTWYEKHFGAKLEEGEQRKKYRNMKAYLKGNMMKSSEFLKVIGCDAKAFRFADLYKECQRRCDSYMQFFAALNKEHGECSIYTEYGGWLEKFMDNIPNKPDFLEACWIIKRRKVSGVGTRRIVGNNVKLGGRSTIKKRDIVIVSMDEL